MDTVEEWIKKVDDHLNCFDPQSKIIKENTIQNRVQQQPTHIQECSYDASVLLHYNTDIVIGGFTGMFISVTERDMGKYRICINASGSGADDVLF